ncbi:BTB domain-containing protein [Mycena chlorophos]|uniref:BTB domain-containing protein n=1 Tax=Mycena chlorophos TaxID=658473 RepID=A0A8H6VZZ3_MYCCL|nr:BTB domain-containing protein [Mycena chlorophos]
MSSYPAEPRAQKRRREGDSDDESSIERSRRHWFDDGNIILQVESTQFRVNKGVLAMHSSGFRDMFTVPLPLDEPLVDGCPVVSLPGDSSEEWTYLLDAIYPKECFQPPPTIPQVSAILRLSNKYDIPAFRKEMVRRLRAHFPSSFADYNDSWEHIQKPSPAVSREYFALLVGCVREVGLDVVLPCLYCVMIPTFFDMNGNLIHSPTRNLDLIDENRLLKASLKFARLQEKSPHIRWCLPTRNIVPCDACPRKDLCRSSAKNLLPELAIWLTPLSVLQPWRNMWSAGLCESCVKVARAAYVDAQKGIWAELPSFFSLADWEELRSRDYD